MKTTDTTATAESLESEARGADTGLDVVTGAFSYSGRAIAAKLLERGRAVRTLTGHPRPDASTPIDVRPFDFADMPALVRDLEGATTLYNTYWVRFAHGRTTHEQAVENSRTLFHAARQAGVQRIVHVSITNPTIASPYPYFRGKAIVERALAETGVSYAILRPAILFGADGVLVNNIAWLLRHLPVFAVGGRGEYRIRPIHVDDLADLCLAAASRRDDSIIDAVGPDRPTFVELVSEIRDVVGSRSPIVRLPGPPAAADLVGAQPRAARRAAHQGRVPRDGRRARRHRRAGYGADRDLRLARRGGAGARHAVRERAPAPLRRYFCSMSPTGAAVIALGMPSLRAEPSAMTLPSLVPIQ